MNQLYEVAGISKQAFHQQLKRDNQCAIRDRSILMQVDLVRQDHPMMGARIIYDKLQPEGIGRDRFEELLLDSGYRVKRRRNYRRTTYAQSLYNFPNLIEGMKLDGPNQVWQTDITYFEMGGKFYFLSFIIDVYTREIVGYAVSKDMRAQANIRALKMAFRNTGKYGCKNLIHHSDRGKQFVSMDYLKLLLDKDIRLSHAYSAMENAYVERLNGIIKNDYLKHFNIKTYKQLENMLKKVVYRYNNQRPHQALPNHLAPKEFAKSEIKHAEHIFNFSTNQRLINKEKRSKKESLH